MRQLVRQARKDQRNSDSDDAPVVEIARYRAGEAVVHRRKVLGTLAAGALSAFGVGVLAREVSGQTDTIAEIKKRGYVIAGFYNERPAGYVDEDRKLTGVFPTVAQAIIKDTLGITEIQPVLTQWASLIPGLQAGRFDMVLAGMFILPERCAQVLFTDPLECATESLVFKKGNPLSVQSCKDIASNAKVRVGLVPGSSQARYIKACGVADSQIQNYSDPVSGLEALKNGRIEVWAGPTDGINAIFMQANYDHSDLDLVSFIPVVNGKKQYGCGGFVFRKTDRRLRDLFNGRIRAWRRTGKLYGLIQQWVPKNEFDAAATVPVGELCHG